MRLQQMHATSPMTMSQNSSRVNYTLSNHNQTLLAAIALTWTTTPATVTATPPSHTASTCVPCSFFSWNQWMLRHLYPLTLTQRRNHHLLVTMTHLPCPLPLHMMQPLSPRPESVTSSKLQPYALDSHLPYHPILLITVSLNHYSTLSQQKPKGPGFYQKIPPNKDSGWVETKAIMHQHIVSKHPCMNSDPYGANKASGSKAKPDAKWAKKDHVNPATR